MRLFWFALIVFQWIDSIQAERILALFPVCSKSHKISFNPVAEALAAKGHQVTIVSPFGPTKKVDNIHEIVIGSGWDKLEVDWFKMQGRNLLVALSSTISDFRGVTRTGYQTLMANDEFQKILHNRDVDLIIVNAVLNDFVLPIVDHLKVPFIFFSPPSVLPWVLSAMGVGMEYASVPTGLGDTDRRNMTSFKHRLVNFVGTEVFFFLRKVQLLWMLDDLAQKDFPGIRSIVEIERDAALCIINYHPATAWPRSFPPTVIPIGPMHTQQPNPLPTDLKALADNAKQGFIVFTLGSAIPVSSMPTHIVDAFIRVFARIPQIVFWKWEKTSDETMESKLPPNVKILTWLPQQDLLGHPNARLFITHGGLVGMQEAVYHGVPLLGLPFGTDQRGNIAKGVEEGSVIKLDWNEVSESLLFDKIQALLNQPSYKGNATRLSNLIKDQMMPAKDVAVYWIEHVLRHDGSKHLQSSAKEMPLYQIYLLDVWLFLSVIILSSMFVTIKLVSFIFCTCFTSKKVKIN